MTEKEDPRHEKEQSERSSILGSGWVGERKTQSLKKRQVFATTPFLPLLSTENWF